MKKIDDSLLVPFFTKVFIKFEHVRRHSKFRLPDPQESLNKEKAQKEFNFLNGRNAIIGVLTLGLFLW